MKWKLQQPKYESNQGPGPGTTQNQMGQKTKEADQEQEAQAPSTRRRPPPRLLANWFRDVCLLLHCLVALVAVALGAGFSFIYFLFPVFGVFSFLFTLAGAAFDQCIAGRAKACSQRVPYVFGHVLVSFVAMH